MTELAKTKLGKQIMSNKARFDKTTQQLISTMNALHERANKIAREKQTSVASVLRNLTNEVWDEDDKFNAREQRRLQLEAEDEDFDPEAQSGESEMSMEGEGDDDEEAIISAGEWSAWVHQRLPRMFFGNLKMPVRIVKWCRKSSFDEVVHIMAYAQSVKPPKEKEEEDDEDFGYEAHTQFISKVFAAVVCTPTIKQHLVALKQYLKYPNKVTDDLTCKMTSRAMREIANDELFGEIGKDESCSSSSEQAEVQQSSKRKAGEMTSAGQPVFSKRARIEPVQEE